MTRVQVEQEEGHASIEVVDDDGETYEMAKKQLDLLDFDQEPTRVYIEIDTAQPKALAGRSDDSKGDESNRSGRAGKSIDGPDNPAEDGRNGRQIPESGFISEDERHPEFEPVSQDSVPHRIAWIMATEFDAVDSGKATTSVEVRNAFTDMYPNLNSQSVTPGFSKMYESRIVDRRKFEDAGKGSARFGYWLTNDAIKMLNELGEPAEVEDDA